MADAEMLGCGAGVLAGMRVRCGRGGAGFGTGEYRGEEDDPYGDLRGAGARGGSACRDL